MKELISLRYLPFGSTGAIVSELGFGGIPIIRLTTEDAVRVLKRAYDRGITFFDTANSYEGSEEKFGSALSGVREKIFIATKSKNRDGKGVTEHIELSLKRMKTDYIDLFQFHQVVQEKDWQAIIAPGGALDAALEARQQGKVRFIGITSHGIPTALKAISTGEFVSIQFPFNFIETGAAESLLPLARKTGLAFIAMKPFAGGAITDASLAFKFLRSHPYVLPIPGCDSVESVDQVSSFYESPNTVSEEDRRAMESIADTLGKEFCRRCEYCQPCPHGVSITLGMTYQLLASRMSPRVACGYVTKALETIPRCVECGACLPKCPYNLPIPDMLKKHYALFREHRKLYHNEQN